MQQKALDIQEKANQYLEIKVQKRTEELKDAQEKILIMEKEAVERQMAGGFAHEMRNALAGAKMVISKALGFGNPDEGQKSICLENSLKLKDVFLKLRNILNEEQLRTVTIIFKEINANEEDLDRILKIVNQATERGLSITNQIMEYSKIGQSAFRKSDLVDIGNIILNIQKESNDLIQKENISLEIQLENSFHLKGDELHFYSVFKNIIQNSIDALIDKTNSKELKRTIQISGKSDLDLTYVFHISLLISFCFSSVLGNSLGCSRAAFFSCISFKSFFIIFFKLTIKLCQVAIIIISCFSKFICPSN